MAANENRRGLLPPTDGEGAGHDVGDAPSTILLRRCSANLLIVCLQHGEGPETRMK
jgi:hypothetical protein